MPVNPSQLWHLVQTPLARFVTFVGGSGGLLYWLRLVRDRPHFTVRILRETAGSTNALSVVSFEVQNLSQTAMSLEPTIEFAGVEITGVARRDGAGRFTLTTPEDRNLPPHTPRRFEMVLKPVDVTFGFLWYRVYRFRATRGWAQRVYLRHIDGPHLSWWRNQYEVRLYRWDRTRDSLLRRVTRG